MTKNKLKIASIAMLALINGFSMSTFAMEEERRGCAPQGRPQAMAAEEFEAPDLSVTKFWTAEEIMTPAFQIRINTQINNIFNDVFSTTIYNRLFLAQNEMLQKLNEVRDFASTEDFASLKSTINDLKSLVNSHGNSLEDFLRGDATLMLSGMVVGLNGPYDIVGNQINALVSEFLNGKLILAHDAQASLDRAFELIAAKVQI